MVPQGIKQFGLFDLDKMLRFTILYLDPLSPFFDERDFNQRKRACLDALKYDQEERFLTEVDELTQYWQQVMFEYFKMINAIDFESWLSSKLAFHIINMELRNPALALDPKKRADTMKAMNEARKNLQSLQADIFPDERTQRIISEKATEDLGGHAEENALNVDFDSMYRNA
jgi:hypothetical protein